MAASRKIEQTLAQLALIDKSDAATLAGQLGPFLASSVNLIVAKAAGLAKSPPVAGAREAELTKAFARFLEKGGGGDKGCAAKQAIATALYEGGCASPETREVFLIGVRWIQMEAVYGGSTDVAAELRGICAMGLVRIGYPRVMECLVDLLADESAQARIWAVRAIAYANQDSGALLLRLKILAGDPDDRVISEALSALGQISGIKALDFFRRYLAAASLDGPLFSAAALAIGEMRNAEALEALLSNWRDHFSRDVREALVLPIALCRLPAAVEFLIKVVAEQPEAMACAALEALAIYQRDPQQRERIIVVVEQRGDAAVTRQFQKSFPVS